MTPTQRDILLFACQNDPERVIELLEMNWSELIIDFNILLNEKTND